MKWKLPYTTTPPEVTSVKSGPSVPAFSTGSKNTHVTQTEVSYTRAAHKEGPTPQHVTSEGVMSAESEPTPSDSSSEPTGPSLQASTRQPTSLKAIKVGEQSSKRAGSPKTVRVAEQSASQLAPSAPASSKTPGQGASPLRSSMKVAKRAVQGTSSPGHLKTVKVAAVEDSSQPASSKAVLNVAGEGTRPTKSSSKAVKVTTGDGGLEHSSTSESSEDITASKDSRLQPSPPSPKAVIGALSSSSGSSNDITASRDGRRQPSPKAVTGALSSAAGSSKRSEDELTPVSSSVGVAASLRVVGEGEEGRGSASASMVSVTDMSESIHSVAEDLEGEVTEDVTIDADEGDDDDTMFEDSGMQNFGPFWCIS